MPKIQIIRWPNHGQPAQRIRAWRHILQFGGNLGRRQHLGRFDRHAFSRVKARSVLVVVPLANLRNRQLNSPNGLFPTSYRLVTISKKAS